MKKGLFLLRKSGIFLAEWAREAKTVMFKLLNTCHQHCLGASHLAESRNINITIEKTYSMHFTEPVEHEKKSKKQTTKLRNYSPRKHCYAQEINIDSYMHAAKRSKWKEIFLCSENLSQHECRHFLSIQNMGLAQIHTCTFVYKKDKDKYPQCSIQHDSTAALQHYIPSTVTLKHFTKKPNAKQRHS